MAAHEEGSGNHEEVQHASGQDGNVRLLPGQRLQGETAAETGFPVVHKQYRGTKTREKKEKKMDSMRKYSILFENNSL